mgnify:CR=1 FL=1
MYIEPINQDRILFPKILSKRLNTTHKKACGKVFIIAGSRNMTGAATLTCRAAMRSGAGYVALAFPEKLNNIYRELLLEAITIPCSQTEDGTFSEDALDILIKKSKGYDVVALGPGLSNNKETDELIRRFIQKVEKPLIIDADGLNAIKNDVNILKKIKKKTIITPHPGEMARLSGLTVNEIQRDRDEVARKYAKEWNVIIVLKGYHTVIAHPDGRTIVNMTGGPALATAGTGDVLLGVISALWADNIKKPLDATATAVYLHGLAGDVVAEKIGEKSVIASDVIDILPDVIKIAQEKINAK